MQLSGMWSYYTYQVALWLPKSSPNWKIRTAAAIRDFELNFENKKKQSIK